jgi:hypothetical protein
MKLKSDWYSIKTLIECDESLCKSSCSFGSSKAPDCVALSHWFRQASHYLDKLILVYFGPVALLCLNMATLGLKGTHRNASKLPPDSYSIMLKLSRGLVLTGWRALPNYMLS